MINNIPESSIIDPVVLNMHWDQLLNDDTLVLNDDTLGVNIDPFLAFGKTYKDMPGLIKRLGDSQSTVHERNMACLSALAVLSGIMTEVKGIYHKKTYYPNLFLMVLARAASGKAVISLCRKLIEQIHNEVLSESKVSAEKFHADMTAYEKKKKKGAVGAVPKRPPFRVVSIPADITPARLVEHLAEADGMVPTILIEEEMDTSAASKKSYGDFSQHLRKAASNETIALSRKTNNQYVECKVPKLALIMSGTPGQLQGVIRNVDDGLYSRSLFYMFDSGIKWESVAPCRTCENLTDLYNKEGVEYHKLWKFLKESPTEVKLTDEQWKKLDKFGEAHLHHFYNFHGEETSALSKRHTMMVFKMCMVLSSIRKYESSSIEPMVFCTDQDFSLAMSIIRISLQSSLEIVKQLPKATNPELLKGKRTFLNDLPENFTRKEYLEVAVKLKISTRSADRWIQNFADSGVLHKVSTGHYHKPAMATVAMADNE